MRARAESFESSASKGSWRPMRLFFVGTLHQVVRCDAQENETRRGVVYGFTSLLSIIFHVGLARFDIILANYDTMRPHTGTTFKIENPV